MPDTKYVCEVLEENAMLKAQNKELLARCDLREFIRNGVELGYIVIPDKGDPARDIIDRICGGEK